MEKEKLLQELASKINPEQMRIDEPMKKHTSFKIGGNADILIRVFSEEELIEVLKVAKEKKIDITVIGNGTNILVRDKGIRGIVVKPELKKIDIKNDKLTVGAGNTLAEIAQVAFKNSLAGMEFASGIPGTIGGAIKMNAGAHGKEMKDIVTEVVALSPEFETVRFSTMECRFDYRHSNFFDELKDYIILSATLQLRKGTNAEIKALMDEYAAYRKERQPISQPSAGSTFKRGDGFITAKLIDEAGLKGLSVGDAVISDLHAGFVVNKGNASCKDVLCLVEKVKKEIWEKFGKTLELEIQIIGEE